MTNDEVLYARVKEVENEIKASQSSLVESENDQKICISLSHYRELNHKVIAGEKALARVEAIENELKASLLRENDQVEEVKTRPAPVESGDGLPPLDPYLEALLRYSGQFYGFAIEAGLSSAQTADAMKHVESAARQLHKFGSDAQIQLKASLERERELREFIQKMRNYFNEFAEDAVRPDEWIMREWVRKCDKQLKAAVTGE